MAVARKFIQDASPGWHSIQLSQSATLHSCMSWHHLCMAMKVFYHTSREATLCQIPMKSALASYDDAWRGSVGTLHLLCRDSGRSSQNLGNFGHSNPINSKRGKKFFTLFLSETVLAKLLIGLPANNTAVVAAAAIVFTIELLVLTVDFMVLHLNV